MDSKKKSIIELIKKNDFVFTKNSFDVCNVTKYECPINLSSNSYISKKPYRFPYADQMQIESRQVSELFKNGMITESSLPYVSPVTMQYKKMV